MTINNQSVKKRIAELPRATAFSETHGTESMKRVAAVSDPGPVTLAA